MGGHRTTSTRPPRRVPIGARAAARQVLAEHLRTFEDEATAARTGNVEAIHRLRVAVRRLGATLRLFGDVLPSTFVERRRSDLAWLGDALGAPRDLDVLAALVERHGERLGRADRAALAPLEEEIRHLRAGARATLASALDSNRTALLVRRLANEATSPRAPRRDPTLEDVVPGLVAPLLRAVVKKGRRTLPSSPANDFHRLRVRLKRLRYAADILGRLMGGDRRRAAVRLAWLQGLLGDHQDAVTVATWLRARAGRSDLEPATLVAMGALIERLERRARRLRRRFPAAWKRLDRPRLGHELGGAR